MKRSGFKRPYSVWFLVPALAIYSVFFLVPTTASFYYAFTNWNTFGIDLQFVGLENVKELFRDPALIHAMKNTLLFAVVTTVGKNLLGLLLALGLNGTLKLQNVWRAVFFLPAILSPIVIGLLFTAILHPDGMLNGFLHSIGLSFLTKAWLSDRNLVMYTVSGVEIWQWAGLHMALYLAGLQSIPREYLEASLVDGANEWKKFLYVTLPLMLPAFNVSLIVSLIGGLKVFGQVYILTGGGPGYASEVAFTTVYEALGDGRWGVGTAMNLMMFLAISLIAFTILSFLKKKEAEL